MVLRLISLVLVLPVTLANVYWASGLDRNVAYIAESSDGRCSMIGWLWPIGVILPWIFLAFGAGSALQLVFRGRFGLSVALLKLHVAHLSLLLVLLLVGNSFCVGAGLWRVLGVFRELLAFVCLVMLIPVPILAMQIAAMRAGTSQKDSAP